MRAHILQSLAVSKSIVVGLASACWWANFGGPPERCLASGWPRVQCVLKLQLCMPQASITAWGVTLLPSSLCAKASPIPLNHHESYIRSSFRVSTAYTVNICSMQFSNELSTQQHVCIFLTTRNYTSVLGLGQDRSPTRIHSRARPFALPLLGTVHLA